MNNYYFFCSLQPRISSYLSLSILRSLKDQIKNTTNY